MARRPREEFEGAVHHVYARGNDRRPIVLDDADRCRYLAMLAEVTGRMRWYCLAFCLMDNHVHLLIETPLANLGRGIQRLHGKYARRFHDRHGTSGHLFQGRYGSVRVRTDSQLQAAAAYIACNPYEAGICARGDAWRWSSHAESLAGRWPSWLAHDRLLTYFGGSGGDARERYRDVVEERLARPRSDALAQ